MAGMDSASFKRLMEVLKGEDGCRVPVGRSHALVDRRDFDLVSQYRWVLNRPATGRCCYATTKLPDGSMVPMHRMIMAPASEMVVDHIDGDGLNNQRFNLRVCSHAENMRNRRSVSASSGYKGVHKHRSQWRVEIRADGVRHRLGCFNSPSVAARVYDKAARELHGAFACTNADLGLFRKTV